MNRCGAKLLIAPADLSSKNTIGERSPRVGSTITRQSFPGARVLETQSHLLFAAHSMGDAPHLALQFVCNMIGQATPSLSQAFARAKATVLLGVDGMVSPRNEHAIEASLAKLPGVKASASFSSR